MPQALQKRTNDDRALLGRIVEEGYSRQTWSGVNLRKSIRGLTASEAGWKPPGSANDIDGIVLHCAFWKHAVRRRLLGNRKRDFPIAGSDWFDTPRPLTDEDWAAHQALLAEQQSKLRETISEVGRDLSFATDAGRRITRQVYGIAMHDMYHAGQIMLIRAQHRRADPR